MRKLQWALAALIFSSSMASTRAAELVVNGDFEKDVEEFVVWPGYVGGAGDAGVNPAEISEWIGTGGHGINPVTAPTNPADIFAWAGAGGRGINPIEDGRAPFRDNGDNDTKVALIQGAGSIWQTVSGLTTGTKYRLTWDYNSRNCCGDQPMGSLLINDSAVSAGDFNDTVFPVLDVNEWYSGAYEFTAAGTSAKVTFASASSAGGDATMLLDNIALSALGNTTNLIANGDFEADEFPVWPGYTGAGQNAPFRDNGNNGSSVAFMQGASTLTQTINGMEVGKTYTVSLDFNARNCCGDAPVGELLINGELIEDFPGNGLTDGIVTPVGGLNNWYKYSRNITATATSMELTISTRPANGGDSTLIIDNVSVSTPSLLGDFNNDAQLTVTDIDLLTQEVQAGTNQASFDVTGDKVVNGDDRTRWVVDLKKTYFGDANLDGEFNSADFVAVFSIGEYEDAIAGNSTWGDGDWDGDGDFNSADFVKAFSDGGYEAGPRAAVSAVPEPTTLGALTLLGLLLPRRRRR